MNDHSDIKDRATRTCADAVVALRRAGVQPEALAEYVPEARRLLVLRKPATMRPLGEVWRLGSLLLDTQGALWAAGRATRAAERVRAGYQSLSREERRDIAAAALRGGYATGHPVNFDAHRLSFDVAELSALGPEGPIGLADGQVRVRWRAGAALEVAPTLEQYLGDRISLLTDPAARAG